MYFFLFILATRNLFHFVKISEVNPCKRFFAACTVYSAFFTDETYLEFYLDSGKYQSISSDYFYSHKIKISVVINRNMPKTMNSWKTVKNSLDFNLGTN